MEDQYNQLRFDISEKVRLHPQQPGIGSLLALDLYPDVEMVDEGQHVKIQGYLRLNGEYKAMADGALHTEQQLEIKQELAYVIPVEITLPAEKARLDRISAEIEMFDYSVLSPFELQIEAVLMIDGLIMEEEQEMMASTAQVNIEQEMQYEMQYEMQQEMGQEVGQEIECEMEQEIEYEMQYQMQQEMEQEIEYEMERELQQEMQQEGQSKGEMEQGIEPAFDFYRAEQLHSRVAAFQEDAYISNYTTANVHDSDQYFSEQPENADQDGYRVETDQEILYTSPLLEQEEAAEEGQIADTRQHKMSRSIMEADWSQWLLKERAESFTPLKMVIAQENETLEDIAGRYNVMISQILRLNKLDNEQIDPGKILYMPS